MAMSLEHPTAGQSVGALTMFNANLDDASGCGV
jgi:hypothetical protein